MIGFTGLCYFYYRVGMQKVIEAKNLEIVSKRMYITALLPLLASFFSYLAYKGILKDEILIKSVDRLR